MTKNKRMEMNIDGMKVVFADGAFDTDDVELEDIINATTQLIADRKSGKDQSRHNTIQHKEVML